ncbi:alpha/beta hydrolase [Limibacter armeniacum]|uniref:alpha/beta fold hydrolase n=1 Tax=Limibacter armeniacum TaxID=466084 RepID=UPI002FE5C148
MSHALLMKYTNDSSRFLTIEGNLIHYQIDGPEDGYPLVMLHGSFSSLHTFDSWTEILKDTFRIYRFDLPGLGLTGAIQSQDYSIKNLMRYLDIFLSRMNIHTCCLIGSSLGGWIAWEYALLCPSKVKQLVLISPAGFIDRESIPLPFRMARTPFIHHIIKYAINRSMLESFVKEVFYNQNKITNELVDRYFDLFSKEGSAEAFYIFVNQNFHENTRFLKNILCPTLIIWGKEDKWIPVKNAHKFHHLIPNNHLVIYDFAGHIPMEEIPEETAEDLLEFLSKHLSTKVRPTSKPKKVSSTFNQ